MEDTQLEHIDNLYKRKLSLIYQPVYLSAKFHINGCTSNVPTFNLLGFVVIVEDIWFKDAPESFSLLAP